MIEHLHAEAGAREAGGAIGVDGCRGKAARIEFGGDFGEAGEGKTAAQNGHNLADVAGAQDIRRSAAKVQARDIGGGGDEAGDLRNFGFQGVDV